MKQHSKQHATSVQQPASTSKQADTESHWSFYVFMGLIGLAFVMLIVFLITGF